MSLSKDHIKAFVFDMDGVLWRGDTAIPGLVELFATLDQLSLDYMFATNNAMKTPATYVQKLASFGVDVPAEKILTSSVTAADYIQSQYQPESVFVVGEAGLHEAVRSRGMEILSPEAVRQGRRAPVLVAGLVQTSLSYELLAMAALVLHDGAHFVATNADLSLPTELGFFPGAGAILAVLTATTGKEPQVVGKPQAMMFNTALRRLELPASEVAMVGDRLSTDIEGAQAVGMQTIMVLTGVSGREEAARHHVQPDHIVDDIARLTKIMTDA